MKQTVSISNKLDWKLIIAYITLMFIGWITIYSAGYNQEHPYIFNINYTYGKQFVWIAISLVIAFFITNLSSKIFSVFAYGYYVLTIILLIIVFFLAKDVNGARAWIDLGFFRLQPSEFAKLATTLALTNYLSDIETNLNNKKHLLIALLIIILPFILILAQHDMGSALVFLSFFFLLNRFGLSNWVIFIGFYTIILSVLSMVLMPLYILLALLLIYFVFLYINKNNRNIKQMFLAGLLVVIISSTYSYSIDYVVRKLDKHQQDRINVMLGKGGNDWNVRQSKIALGSGQFFGKGFLKGTQSKGNFLPAKETDFIFCTVGEEWGFFGCVLVLGLILFIMLRILYLAEKQKSKFSKIYGYGIVCVLMIHYLINIGMTLGVVPVIGIPLPAMSYGGSSLISFTIMIFIFVRMDCEKWVYTS